MSIINFPERVRDAVYAKFPFVNKSNQSITSITEIGEFRFLTRADQRDAKEKSKYVILTARKRRKQTIIWIRSGK